jgi:hypothetical protein
MRTIIALIFSAASMIAVPLPVAFAAGDVALACDGDVPAEWRRPGGFCDHESGGTLSGPSTECDPSLVVPVRYELDLEAGQRAIVAAIDPCCAIFTDYQFDPETDRLIIAEACAVPCDVGLLFGQEELPIGDRIMLVGC